MLVADFHHASGLPATLLWTWNDHIQTEAHAVKSIKPKVRPAALQPRSRYASPTAGMPALQWVCQPYSRYASPILAPPIHSLRTPSSLPSTNHSRIRYLGYVQVEIQTCSELHTPSLTPMAQSRFRKTTQPKQLEWRRCIQPWLPSQSLMHLSVFAAQRALVLSLAQLR